jgi:hypothetical protein
VVPVPDQPPAPLPDLLDRVRLHISFPRTTGPASQSAASAVRASG